MEISKKSVYQVKSNKILSVIIHAPDSEYMIEELPYEPNIETLALKSKFRKEKSQNHFQKIQVSQVSNQISDFLNDDTIRCQQPSDVFNSASSFINSNEFEGGQSEGQRKINKKKPISLACSTVCVVF